MTFMRPLPPSLPPVFCDPSELNVLGRCRRRLLLLTGFERSRTCGFAVAVCCCCGGHDMSSSSSSRNPRLSRTDQKYCKFDNTERPTSESRVGGYVRLRVGVCGCGRGRRRGELVVYGTMAWIQYSKAKPGLWRRDRPGVRHS